MSDSVAKAHDLVAKADKKLKGWALFGNKYEEALELLEKAVNGYKLGKACAHCLHCLHCLHTSLWLCLVQRTLAVCVVFSRALAMVCVVKDNKEKQLVACN